MKNNDEILIGACDVYMYEFTGTEIPEHATIETEEHDVGHCSSGFTVNYKPTKYDVKNQYGQIVKSAITEEAISAKTGVYDDRPGRIGICNRVGEQRSNDRCRINSDQESKRFPCKF